MINTNSVKIGVIGVGHLGNFHVQQIQEIPQAELVGIFDENPERAMEISKTYKIPRFEVMEDLFAKCDAVSIVTPTSFHHQVALAAMAQNCHVFIEKPITKTIPEARDILKKAESKNLIVQVGHIEQFNPAFLAISDLDIKPRFIECHRLSPFNPRGTDVPVVLDLMIHDIGIILSLVPAGIKNIHASGVNVVSNTADIANVRIEFNDGCVANLTSSRISQKQMRKLRIFQNNNYITIDFLLGSVESYRVEDALPVLEENQKSFKLEGHKEKYVIYNKPDVKSSNALRLELAHFLDSIIHQRKPMVDGHSATEALELAIQIQNIIDDLT
jgi:predicted dehydrogenase